MVKCADCGFLAVRTSPNVSEVPYLAEMLASHRSEARIAWPSLTYSPRPLCFMRVPWFHEQMEEVPNDPYPDLSPVIHVEQSCREFTEWLQGFTPKEHQESLDQDEREKRQRFQLMLIMFGGGFFTVIGAVISQLIPRIF